MSALYKEISSGKLHEFGVRLPEFISWSFHLPAILLYEKHLIVLCLSFLSC